MIVLSDPSSEGTEMQWCREMCSREVFPSCLLVFCLVSLCWWYPRGKQCMRVSCDGCLCIPPAHGVLPEFSVPPSSSSYTSVLSPPLSFSSSLVSSSFILLFLAEHLLRFTRPSCTLRHFENCFDHCSVHQKDPLAKSSYSQRMEVYCSSKPWLE